MQTVERFMTSAPAETVWRILADVEHWREWTPTMVEVSPLTEEGLQVGARYRIIQPGLPPAIYEVTECTSKQSFTWVQRLAGGQLIADHRIVARDGATEVELSFSSKGLLANIATMLFKKKTRESVATEARCLKEKCEAMMHS